MESFYFPETMQVLSNPTPIIQRSISKTKPPVKQKPTTIDLIIYKHSTHYIMHIAVVGLSGSSQTTEVKKGNLGLTSFFHST